MLNCGNTSLDRNVPIVVMIMVESTKIRSYQFKPTDVSGNADEEEDRSESEN